MGALFNRQFSLSIGGIGIATSVVDPTKIHSTLRTAFKVERTLQPEPNSADITVWNLAPDSRVALSQGSPLPTVLEVGYSGQTFQIYSGDMTYVASVRQGVDWVTKIQLKDGGKKYQSARINESMAAGTPLSAAIQAAATAIGIPPGNLSTHLSNIRGAIQAFPKGITLSGKAVDQFTKLMKLAGFTWSIQDGQLQVLAPGEPVPGESVVLNFDSGLIGSPEVGENGIVKARSLLQPGLMPGFVVLLDSVAGTKPISGSFKIERSVFVGDTWGQDWYADIEARPL